MVMVSALPPPPPPWLMNIRNKNKNGSIRYKCSAASCSNASRDIEYQNIHKLTVKNVGEVSIFKMIQQLQVKYGIILILGTTTKED